MLELRLRVTVFSQRARVLRLEEAIQQVSSSNPFELVWYASMDDNANFSFVLQRQVDYKLELVIVNRGTVFNLMNLVQDIDVYRQILWRNQDQAEGAAISSGIDSALGLLANYQGNIVNSSNEGETQSLLEFIKHKKLAQDYLDIYITGTLTWWSYCFGFEPLAL